LRLKLFTYDVKPVLKSPLTPRSGDVQHQDTKNILILNSDDLNFTETLLTHFQRQLVIELQWFQSTGAQRSA